MLIDQITQKDVDLAFSHNKRVKLKVALLDELYRETDELTGNIKSSSYDVSSTSNIRRTSSLTLSVPKADQINKNFDKEWISHLVELSCGIYSMVDGDYIWYPLGRMLMVSADTTFDATTQEVKLSLVDMMATLTMERGSQLGTDLVFPEGSNIKEALIEIISTFSPYKKIHWDKIPEKFGNETTVPYDITVSSGNYPFEALRELLNLVPYYEMFYDSDGYFIVQEIPTKIADSIDVPKSVIDPLLINEKRAVKYSDVKNTTEIWGRTLDSKYTTLNCVTSITDTGARYDLTIDDTFEALVVNDTYSFTPDTDSVAGQSIKIQETEEYKIYTQTGDGEYSLIEAGAMQSDTHYVVKYVDEKFVLQGPSFIHVIVQEIVETPSPSLENDFKMENGCNDVRWVVNPESPFACTIEPTTGKIEREIRQVLQGGEYDAIYTTELAFERASYENWLKTRLQDNVELEMVLLPWMDVNLKIQYTSPTSGEEMTLITQSVSFDFAKWTMTVKGSKFYPYYPWW